MSVETNSPFQASRATRKMKEQSLGEGDALNYLIIDLELEFIWHSTKYPNRQCLLLDALPSGKIHGALCPVPGLDNGQCLSRQKT